MDRGKKVRSTAAGIVIGFAVLGNFMRFFEPAGAAYLGIDGVSLEALEAGKPLPYVEEQIDAGFLDVLRAKEVVFRTYTLAEATPVWLFMGYFDKQKEGSQVHSPIHCYPGSGWSILSEDDVGAPWGTDAIKALVVSDGFDQRLVFYWYQTPENIINDVFHLKLQLIKNAVVRKPQELVFVRISTPMNGDREAARQRLRTYAAVVKEKIEGLYRKRHETG